MPLPWLGVSNTSRGWSSFTAYPMISQFTKSLEWSMGSPGMHWKELAVR